MIQDVAAVVAAAANTRGIGYQGQLPWKLPGDMAHFQKVTTQAPVGKVNAVVMGRKTWESIPPRFRPLPGRTNLILTSHNSAITTNNAAFPDHVLVASSLPEAWSQLEQHVPNLHQVFVIGGAQVYQACLEAGYITRVIYTQVSNLPDHTPMDTFFPDLPASDWECQPFVQDAHDDGVVSKDDMVHHNNDKENQHNAPVTTPTTTTKLENSGKLQSPLLHTDPSSGLQYQFLEYTKIPQGPDVNPEEMQYLQLCRDILDTGVVRGDRTGTGTRSKFGVHMRFNLRNGVLPLLTTKRTFWRGVAEELLWFISGNTNANVLAAKDIHIWDGNGSREFLDHRGLSHREEGDLGPVYGFQWRHFGATYVDMHTDYTGQGVDQLADCIDKIIHTPEDRRIIMSAWNPADLHLMALPPCHMFCQFYVDTTTNEVSCQMYQRSADMGLGVPFNIASYALLTHLIAHVTGRKPGELIHTIGDAHIYLNHVNAIQEQLQRQPRAFPTLTINPNKMNIDDIVYDDLEVKGYKPHKAIPMKMAV